MAWNGSDQTKVGAGAAPRRGGTDVGAGGSAETTRGAKDRLGGALTADRCNKRHGLLAGLIVVALGGAAVWWFFGRTSPDSNIQTSKHSNISPIAEVAPHIPTNAPRQLTPEEKEALAHPGMRKASNGVWQPADRPYVAGRKKVHGVVTNAPRRTVAKGAVDQILLGIFTRSLGDMPMPLPDHIPPSELKRLASILIDNHAEKSGDSDLDKINKQTLREAKAAALEYIKQGGTFEDFIRSYHKELTRAYNTRTQSQRYLNRALRDGEDPAVISDMAKSINAKLKEQGIRQIPDPTRKYANRGTEEVKK